MGTILHQRTAAPTPEAPHTARMPKTPAGRSASLRIALACTSLFFATAAHADAADEAAQEHAFPLRITASTGFDFSTGDFGGAVESDFWYVPFSLRVDWGDATVKLTVPYLRLTESANLFAGEPGGLEQDGRVDGSTLPTATTGSTRLPSTRDGLGDLQLEGRYTLRAPCAWLPDTRLSGKIKFGTASQRRGLGTGENDYALELDFSKTLGRVLPFAGFGYRFVADPRISDGTKLHLRNKWNAYAGLSASLTRSLGAGIVYDWRQSSVRGRDDFHELQPFVSWRVHDNVAIDPYLLIGLAGPTPDIGTGLQIRFILDRR